MCGADCAEWKNHALECDAIKNVDITELDKFSPDLLRLVVLTLRLIEGRRRNPKVNNRTKFLKDKGEYFEQDSEEWQKQKSICVDFIVNALGHTDAGEVSWAAATVRARCVPSTGSGGCALFPVLSLARHACVRNAKFAVHGPNQALALLAQTNILQSLLAGMSY